MCFAADQLLTDGTGNAGKDVVAKDGRIYNTATNTWVRARCRLGGFR
jgi:hypothetical protein